MGLPFLYCQLVGLEQAPKGLLAVVRKGLLVGLGLPACPCQLLGKHNALLVGLPVCVGLCACVGYRIGKGYRIGLAV